jgi:hypothetical protein
MLLHEYHGPAFRVARSSIGARQFREVYVQLDLDLTTDFRPASRAACDLSFLPSGPRRLEPCYTRGGFESCVACIR